MLRKHEKETKARISCVTRACLHLDYDPPTFSLVKRAAKKVFVQMYSHSSLIRSLFSRSYSNSPFPQGQPHFPTFPLFSFLIVASTHFLPLCLKCLMNFCGVSPFLRLNIFRYTTSSLYFVYWFSFCFGFRNFFCACYTILLHFYML